MKQVFKEILANVVAAEPKKLSLISMIPSAVFSSGLQSGMRQFTGVGRKILKLQGR